MNPAVDRRLIQLLAFSFLLHASLLLIVRRSPEPVPELPLVLTALLRPAVPAPSPRPPLAEKPPKAEKTPVSAARPLVRPREATPSERAVAVPAVTAEPARSEPPAVAQIPPRAVEPVAPVNPQLAVDALNLYRQQLQDLLGRPQEYPRVAAMRGWEGEVRLRLKIARRGQLLSVQIERSSGFEVLDQHALAMVDRQASLPPLPEAYAGSEVQVVVPVLYKLRKAT